MKRSGFTIIELLICIFIIGIVLAFIIPSLSESRESARRTKCLSNLNQLRTATVAISNERKAVPLAHGDIREEELGEWDTPRSVFFCPSDPNPEYLRYYVYVPGVTMMQMGYPNDGVNEKFARRTWDMYDKNLIQKVFYDYTSFHKGFRPENRYNAVFWDGPAKQVSNWNE